MIERGGICWFEASRAAGRRPVVVVQSDAFNQSLIPTVLVAPLAQDLRLAAQPGNVLVPADASGLRHDTVALLSELGTLERAQLRPAGARLSGELLGELDEGLRVVLGLDGRG